MCDQTVKDCLDCAAGRIGVFIVKFRTSGKMICKFLTSSHKYKQFSNPVMLSCEAWGSSYMLYYDFPQIIGEEVGHFT